MASPFAVYITARFERDYRSLLKQHTELAADYATVVGILSTDPHNRTRKYPIKKLEQVAAGEGQYRMRSGRFRFRFDIEGTSVYLKACSLRREDTYR
jgi:mRNA-degrading endonuclease RelE of RelBE toxin-antitoxin system